jgi:drug/metabolite transporter (DMT)-like permease
MQLSVFLAALLAVTVWGASPVATKFAVTELPPLAVAFLRTAVGGAAAGVIIVVMQMPVPRERYQRLLLAASGFCGFIGFPTIFSIGQRQTSAIHGAMILAMLPAMTGVVALVWERRKPESLFVLGCLVALVGEAVLSLSRQGIAGGEAGLIGDALVFFSALFASVGYVCGARLQQSGYPAKAVTFWGVLLASIALLPFAPISLAQVQWASLSSGVWLAIAYLALGVTIFGYVFWYWALGKGGIAKIGLFQFFQPVTGVVMAFLILGEPLSLGLVIAAAVILLGVWLALRPRNRHIGEGP